MEGLGIIDRYLTKPHQTNRVPISWEYCARQWISVISNFSESDTERLLVYNHEYARHMFMRSAHYNTSQCALQSCQSWPDHIEAETKKPPFSRRLFQLHFPEWKIYISVKISLKFVSKGSINNIPTLVQIMAYSICGHPTQYFISYETLIEMEIFAKSKPLASTQPAYLPVHSIS